MEKEEIETLAEALISAIQGDLTNAALALIFTQLITIAITIWATQMYSEKKKLGELNAVKKGFSEFKKQQREITSQNQKIIKDLEKGTIEYQIRLASYHEKQISAVTTLFEKLVRLKELMGENALNQSSEQQALFVTEFKQFTFDLDTSRIWISNNVYQSILYFSQQIDQKISGFFGANVLLDRDLSRIRSEVLEKAIQKQEGFYDYLHQGELDQQFQNLVQQISEEVSAQRAIS